MATPASYDVNVKEQTGRELVRNGVKYSMADQVARFRVWVHGKFVKK